MRERGKRNAERGLAMLETAGVLLVVLPLLFGVAGLLDYLGTTMAVRAEVDKAVYENATSPLRLVVRDGRASTELNHDQVTSFVEAAAQEIEENLRARLGGDFPASNKFIVEARAVAVTIDPHSGRRAGSILSVHEVRRGGLQPSGEAQEATDLTAAFERLASATMPGPRGTSIAALAIPSGTLGREGSAEYLDRGVLIGARAVLALDDTLTGELFGVVGGDATAYEGKAIQLRGELQ